MFLNRFTDGRVPESESDLSKIFPFGIVDGLMELVHVRACDPQSEATLRPGGQSVKAKPDMIVTWPWLDVVLNHTISSKMPSGLMNLKLAGTRVVALVSFPRCPFEASTTSETTTNILVGWSGLEGQVVTVTTPNTRVDGILLRHVVNCPAMLGDGLQELRVCWRSCHARQSFTFWFPVVKLARGAVGTETIDPPLSANDLGIWFMPLVTGLAIRATASKKLYTKELRWR